MGLVDSAQHGDAGPRHDDHCAERTPRQHRAGPAGGGAPGCRRRRSDAGRPPCRGALRHDLPRGARGDRGVRPVRARRRRDAGVGPRIRRPRCSRRIIDNAYDGIVVTDAAGRVLYANATYLDLFGARSATTTCARSSACSSAIPMSRRRSTACSRPRGKAAACRRRCALPAPRGEAARWLRLRVRPLGESKRDARMTVWSIADVTRDRERAGERVPGTPARDRLSRPRAGRIFLGRCRAAHRLSQRHARRLARSRSRPGGRGRAQLADIVAGEGAALLTTLIAAPGEVKTEVLDLDLQTARRQPLPVRLFHKVAFGADGDGRRLAHAGAQPRHGRRQRFRSAPRKCASCASSRTRRWRSPPSTTGRIARSNARFASAFESVLKGTTSRSILRCIAERDRPDDRGGARQGGGRPGRHRAGRGRAHRRGRTLGEFLRLRGGGGGERRRDGDRLRARDHRAARARKPRPTSSRRWTWSASSPAASRTTSTTCSPPS